MLSNTLFHPIRKMTLHLHSPIPTPRSPPPHGSGSHGQWSLSGLRRCSWSRLVVCPWGWLLSPFVCCRGCQGLWDTPSTLSSLSDSQDSPLNLSNRVPPTSAWLLCGSRVWSPDRWWVFDGCTCSSWFRGRGLRWFLCLPLRLFLLVIWRFALRRVWRCLCRRVLWSRRKSTFRHWGRRGRPNFWWVHELFLCLLQFSPIRGSPVPFWLEFPWFSTLPAREDHLKKDCLYLSPSFLLQLA